MIGPFQARAAACIPPYSSQHKRFAAATHCVPWAPIIAGRSNGGDRPAARRSRCASVVFVSTVQCARWFAPAFPLSSQHVLVLASCVCFLSAETGGFPTLTVRAVSCLVPPLKYREASRVSPLAHGRPAAGRPAAAFPSCAPCMYATMHPPCQAHRPHCRRRPRRARATWQAHGPARRLFCQSASAELTHAVVNREWSAWQPSRASALPAALQRQARQPCRCRCRSGPGNAASCVPWGTAAGALQALSSKSPRAPTGGLQRLVANSHRKAPPRGASAPTNHG